MKKRKPKTKKIKVPFKTASKDFCGFSTFERIETSCIAWIEKIEMCL